MTDKPESQTQALLREIRSDIAKMREDMRERKAVTPFGDNTALWADTKEAVSAAIRAELDRHEKRTWHVDICLAPDRSIEMQVQAATSREALIEAISQVKLEEGELFHTVHIGRPS